MAAASSQAASVSDSAVSSRIECPVCCEIFRTPKCLTCGHSVCADCCQKLLPLLGNSISCPVCRRPTSVPPGGLPTNFALQDLIQHYQNDEQKRYRCMECDRSCTADEAWLMSTKADEEMAPRCFRCIIVKHSGPDTAASALPAGMESVTDRIRRHDSDLSKLKRRLTTFSNEQREWTHNVQQAAWVMKTRVDDIVEASQALQKMTMEDVDKLNNEFQLLSVQTNSVKVPQSLDGLGPFKQSIQDTASKLDQLADARRRTITRANVALNSLAIGLDCLLNAGEDKEGRDAVGEELGTSRGEGDGFVTPPQERAVEQRPVASASASASAIPGPLAAAPAASASPLSSPQAGAVAGVSTSPSAAPQQGNVFSLYPLYHYPLRGGQRRVVAVHVRRGRGRPAVPSRPAANP